MSHFHHLEHVICIGLRYLLLVILWQDHGKSIKSWWLRVKDGLPRSWKPKTPEDSPRWLAGFQLQSVTMKRDVRAWNQRKSARGAKKQQSTQGFACLNPVCESFGIRDEQIHALVGNGKRGEDQDI